jgi:hypothetical protein
MSTGTRGNSKCLMLNHHAVVVDSQCVCSGSKHGQMKNKDGQIVTAQTSNLPLRVQFNY